MDKDLKQSFANMRSVMEMCEDYCESVRKSTSDELYDVNDMITYVKKAVAKKESLRTDIKFTEEEITTAIAVFIKDKVHGSGYGLYLPNKDGGYTDHSDEVLK